ncbi:helix-turn-helix domain-containing protein [Negadavirga shengliensis]|uniref:Helix-turn-helix domain-containing protein n=1 Tax=Negadavirga shengliensis TaxID=1389218 RepID=A0ABV9SW83_9BACT
MFKLGLYLRKIREHRRLSLEKVAEYLEIRSSLLMDIESGKQIPSKRLLLQWGGLFSMDEIELLQNYQKQRIQHELNGKTDGLRATTGITVNAPQAFPTRHQNMIHELTELTERDLVIKVHKPLYPLNQYIESITYYHGRRPDYSWERVIPDGMTQLLIHLNDGQSRWVSRNEADRTVCGGTSVMGMQNQYLSHQVSPNERTIMVRFRIGALYAFTGISQSELSDKITDGAALFGKKIAHLREKIGEHEDPQEIFSLIDRFLLLELKKQDFQKNAVIDYMIANINQPYAFLIKKTGYSQKHLIQLFKKHVGTTPKYLQRIMRFAGIMEKLQLADKNPDWMDVVYRHQYHDQAHFIKDFSHFMGMSPGRYMESGNTCSRFIRMR